MNIQRVLDLLSERIGLNPDSLGPTTVAKLVEQRMKNIGLVDPIAYAEFLSRDAREFQTLVEGTVVVESWFFRGGDLFSFLTKEIASRAGPVPFRVLSIPCCTGEEPYSLAIALLEAGVPRKNWSIVGVDLSAREIAQALVGSYSDFSFRQFPAGLKDRYFKAESGRWQIAENLRGTVEFRQGNLIEPTFLQQERPFDLIFCRNVMIYLTSPARAKALDNLERLLAADGLIVMGHSEPLSDPRFEPGEPREFFHYRRKSNAPVPKSTDLAPVQSQKYSATPPRRKAIPARLAAPLKAPVPTVATLTEAKQLADRGEIEAALGVCRRLETASAVTADVYHLMGVLHLARASTDEAGACFRKALYLDPDHVESLVHLVHQHKERGDAKQADLYRRRLERLGVGGAE